VPVGLGSHTQWDRKLDGRLAQAVMSTQAIKAFEIGDGWRNATVPGSQVHDPVFHDEERGYHRPSNRAGGLEAGITNGEELVVRAAMKPIATLMKPLPTVDVVTHEPADAARERSDTTAVPAASIVVLAMAALVLADALLEKFGADTVRELRERVDRPPRLRGRVLTVPRRHVPDRPVTWVAMAGFMGAGKSRIGWELSRRLQLTFIDTDRVIERVACMRISEIFELYGEATFRDYETEIVRRCLKLDEVVISTGGGTVVREENRRLLRSRGPVVVLEATPETVYRRTRRHRRPLLEGDDPLERIRTLMAQRAPFYDDAASIKVASDGRESAEVVEEIVEKLRAWKERSG
jgi:shikimate kinase